MNERPRRNRKSSTIRDLVRETELHVSDFIYPLFLV
ncbi:MAG: porphobilinogen synthase, partial [Flavobacteriales bacterium]